MFRRPASARRAIAPPHLSHRQRAGNAARTTMNPHLVPAMRVACKIREQALALAPERTRELVAVFEDCRKGRSLQSEVFAAVDAELVGASPIEAAATDAAMRSVRWSLLAEDHPDPGYSLACMAEAAEALGILRALVRPPEELREHLKAEVLTRVAAQGGRSRAATYDPKAEEVRKMFEEWKAGRLKIPDARPKTRRLTDFDHYAARALGINERTVADYRKGKRR